MQFSYRSGLAHAVQTQFHLCHSLQATSRGSHELERFFYLLVFSLACYNTLPVLPYQLPRGVTFWTRGPCFSLSILQGITSWEHQEWFIHHLHPCLCHSSGNASSSEGSFPQVAICVHCPGAFALHPELVFPKLLLQIHHGVLSSWLCSETVLEYAQDDFSTAAFNFWLWQSK